MKDFKLKRILDLKTAALDPSFARSRKTGDPKEQARLSSLYADKYRLAPTDGVLEFHVIFSSFVLWVPVVPAGNVEVAEGPITWREWLFQLAHGRGMLACHRTANETFQVLRRMAFWESLPTDCDRFYKECTVCLKFRAHPLQGPYKSMLAEPSTVVVLPFQDVIMDVQGPFTKAEGGEQYVLSCHCTRLKVPMLEVMRSLSTGHFSRALMNCVLRTRVIPDIVRSDRGPEMVNKVLCMNRYDEVTGTLLDNESPNKRFGNPLPGDPSIMYTIQKN